MLFSYLPPQTPHFIRVYYFDVVPMILSQSINSLDSKTVKHNDGATLSVLRITTGGDGPLQFYNTDNEDYKCIARIYDKNDVLRYQLMCHSGQLWFDSWNGNNERITQKQLA